MTPSVPPAAVRRPVSSSQSGQFADSASAGVSSSLSPTQPNHPSSSAPSPLNPNWQAAPAHAYGVQRSGSGGSHTSSSDNDTHRGSGSAEGQSGEGGGPNTDDPTTAAVASNRIGSAYSPFSYQFAPTAVSQQPLLAQGPSTSRFSSALSDTSLASSNYNSPSQSPYHFSNGDRKRDSHAGSLMGVTAGGGTGATTTMLLWDEKDPEMDDALHRPDPPNKKKRGLGFSWSTRGCINMGTLFLLIGALLTLFAGYPIISEYRKNGNSFTAKKPTGFNLGGINGTGQVPVIPGLPSLVDKDTPDNVKTRTGFDGFQYNLIFSDEFEQDGRTFYPGDDPYWEAVDLHYWPTADFEYYHPRGARTEGGHLILTMTERDSHGLNFESGMVQSWNKFCFTGGYFEVSASLPGNNKVGGFWPGIWLMGNLGRPGYGASTDGVWPYSYDSCDVGTMPNQTNKDGSGPTAALTTGYNGGGLSFLPGQKLSACTCKGQDHPGPNVGVGRGAPEIDILEGQVDVERELGQMSQSAQYAPFDDAWEFNTAETTTYSSSVTKWNTYLGGPYQQAVSGLSYVDSAQSYNGAFNSYGVEYHPNKANRNDAFITWQVGNVPTWTMNAAAVGPNSKTQIGQRLVSEEPMSIVMNFGMSNGFQPPDFFNLKWPAELHIDYVRVYQRAGEENYGCDPADYPTADYISRHADAYANPNKTIWADTGEVFPRSSLREGC